MTFSNSKNRFSPFVKKKHPSKGIQVSFVLDIVGFVVVVVVIVVFAVVLIVCTFFLIPIPVPTPIATQMLYIFYELEEVNLCLFIYYICGHVSSYDGISRKIMYSIVSPCIINRYQYRKLN